MNWKYFNAFKLKREKESFSEIKTIIEKGSIFQGTNLWVLIFAILIASLGLNLNSTAVIIGAMLISPLMGPIVGVGIGVAINDLPLIKLAIRNHIFAAFIGLAVSTLYFIVTPINDAHSEILARTQPTLYDVFIAFFGGFAGIIAISSKQKGNVIPGVAIATALMPPLCTAGYAIATWQLSYFFGAIYLYLINSVFISLATVITALLLKFPKKKYEDSAIEKREKTIIWVITVVTLVPSIFLGRDIVAQNQFESKANDFIEKEAIFPNDFLLRKEIDAKLNSIVLTYGGEEISESEIIKLTEKLKFFDLENASLEIKQGFSFLNNEANTDKRINQIALALNEKTKEFSKIKSRNDSIDNLLKLQKQVYLEIKSQYPLLKSGIIQPSSILGNDSISKKVVYLVILEADKWDKSLDKSTLTNWLKVRLTTDSVQLVIK